MSVLRQSSLVIALLMSLGCTGDQRRGTGRQVVAVALPAPHDRYGPHADAPVSFVEFGSHMCGLCRRFAIEQFPVLDSVFFQTGRARYRYVDAFPNPDAILLGGFVECLSDIVGGFWAARVMIYLSPPSDYHALTEATARQLRVEPGSLRACADSMASSPRAFNERRAARALGVPGTPTFLIGEVTSRGKLVGWPSVGLVPLDTLVRHLEEAEALVLRARAQNK
jgi:protein-disulfide isomerase